MKYNQQNTAQFLQRIIKLRYRHNEYIHSIAGKITQIRKHDIKFSGFGRNNKSTIKYHDIENIADPDEMFGNELHN